MGVLSSQDIASAASMYRRPSHTLPHVRAAVDAGKAGLLHVLKAVVGSGSVSKRRSWWQASHSMHLTRASNALYSGTRSSDGVWRRSFKMSRVGVCNAGKCDEGIRCAGGKKMKKM